MVTGRNPRVVCNVVPGAAMVYESEEKSEGVASCSRYPVRQLQLMEPIRGGRAGMSCRWKKSQCRIHASPNMIMETVTAASGADRSEYLSPCRCTLERKAMVGRAMLCRGLAKELSRGDCDCAAYRSQ